MTTGFFESVEQQDTERTAGNRVSLAVRFFDWLLGSLDMMHPWHVFLPVQSPSANAEESAPPPAVPARYYALCDRTGGFIATGGHCGPLSRMC